VSRRERRHELDGYRVRVRVRLRLTLAVTLLTYAPGRARRARERSPPRAPAGAPRGAAAERARRRVRRRPDRVALARRAASAAHLPRAAPDSRRPQLAHRGSMSLRKAYARPRCCRREGSVHGTVYSRHRSVELLYTTSVWAESRAEYLDECTSLTRYVAPVTHASIAWAHAPLLSHANITGWGTGDRRRPCRRPRRHPRRRPLAAAAASLAAADLSLL
jgi:hypothetical protein